MGFRKTFRSTSRRWAICWSFPEGLRNYTEAAENSEVFELPSGRNIQIVSAPYFLMTKLTAFDGRGEGDYLLSHDIEDIVAVMDGRPGIVNDVIKAKPELVKKLSERFHTLLQEERFVEAVSGHMPADEISQARVINIINTMKNIAEIK